MVDRNRDDNPTLRPKCQVWVWLYILKMLSSRAKVGLRLGFNFKPKQISNLYYSTWKARSSWGVWMKEWLGNNNITTHTWRKATWPQWSVNRGLHYSFQVRKNFEYIILNGLVGFTCILKAAFHYEVNYSHLTIHVFYDYSGSHCCIGIKTIQSSGLWTSEPMPGPTVVYMLLGNITEC